MRTSFIRRYRQAMPDQDIQASKNALLDRLRYVQIWTIPFRKDRAGASAITESSSTLWWTLWTWMPDFHQIGQLDKKTAVSIHGCTVASMVPHTQKRSTVQYQNHSIRAFESGKMKSDYCYLTGFHRYDLVNELLVIFIVFVSQINIFTRKILILNPFWATRIIFQVPVNNFVR
jgi:hypothetical protein